MSKKSSSIFGFNSDDVRSGAVEAPAKGDSLSGKPPSAVGKWVYILVVAVISALLAVALINNVVDRVNEGLVMELQIGDIVPSDHEDGLYSGKYSTAGMGAAVTVDITSGYIIDISLDEFADIDTSRAQTVFNAVIAAQSLETGNDDIGSQPASSSILSAG